MNAVLPIGLAYRCLSTPCKQTDAGKVTGMANGISRRTTGTDYDIAIEAFVLSAAL